MALQNVIERYNETIYSQFHQHFTNSFCANDLALKKIQSQTVISKKLRKILSYKKGTSKMLMKLTPRNKT